MSREILFRGRRIDNNDWVYGSYIQNNIDCPCIIDMDAEQYEVHIYTIGQYTGLNDKNGVKIFEGDILNIHQTVNGVNLFVIMSCIGGYEVRYFYDGKPQREYEYSIYELLEIGIIDKELEVIGNIHDK